MERATDLLAFHDQDSTFCVDDFFSNPPPNTNAEDVDFVTNWIETAIAEPDGPMPATSGELPCLDLNTENGTAPSESLPPFDPSVDILSSEASYKLPDILRPAEPVKQEHVADLIYSSAMPSPVASGGNQPLVRNRSTNIPLFEVQRSVSPATTQGQTATPPHPQYGYRTLPPKSFPYRPRIGDPGLPVSGCRENCTCQQGAPGSPAPEISVGGPLTTSTASLVRHNVEVSVQPLTQPPSIPTSSTPTPQLATPEHSTLTAYPGSLAPTGQQNAVYRVPSSASGTSFVTQASLQVARPEQSRGITKTRNRYSKGATASNYCHICGRNSRIEFAVCSNTKVGLCRKVVCDKCLLLYERECFHSAKEPQGQWKCMHCRSICPPRARCKQYTRNNQRRRARKAEAALKKAQERQQAAHAAEENREILPLAQSSQQIQPATLITPVPPTPQVPVPAPVKQRRQRAPKVRRKGQQKPPTSQQASPSPPPLPKASVTPQQALQWVLEDDLTILGSSHVQASSASPVGMSSQHGQRQGADLFLDSVLSAPVPATPPGRGQKRGYSQMTSTPVGAQLPHAETDMLRLSVGSSVGLDMNGIQLDNAEAKITVTGSEGKRRRVVGVTDPFADGISPVSIANLMMPGGYNGGPFADPGL